MVEAIAEDVTVALEPPVVEAMVDEALVNVSDKAIVVVVHESIIPMANEAHVIVMGAAKASMGTGGEDEGIDEVGGARTLVPERDWM